MAWRFCPTCKDPDEFDPTLEADERGEFNCSRCVVERGLPIRPEEG
jgi:hypothetical protein